MTTKESRKDGREYYDPGKQAHNCVMFERDNHVVYNATDGWCVGACLCRRKPLTEEQLKARQEERARQNAAAEERMRRWHEVSE
jgi:hypothetical protein